MVLEGRYRLGSSSAIGLMMLAWTVTSQAAPASAQSLAHRGGDFGLGLIIGDPTGVNGKYFLSSELAIDGAIGFGVLGGHHTKLQADFLWHFGVDRWSAAALDLYLGVGPALAVHDHHDHNHDHGNLWIGARAPFGASLAFSKVPLDVFLELAVGLWLVEHLHTDLDAAIGVRYWF